MYTKLVVAASVVALARAQGPGSLKSNPHPALTGERSLLRAPPPWHWKCLSILLGSFFSLPILRAPKKTMLGAFVFSAHRPAPLTAVSRCTASGCTESTQSVVLDSNWMWAHAKGKPTNCYTGDEWDKTLCPDPVTCAKNCYLDGGDYGATYGASTSGAEISLKFVTKGQYGVNVGSRTYLMHDDSTYEMFKLKNREFTVDVDASTLPCGLNGALEPQRPGPPPPVPRNRAHRRALASTAAARSSPPPPPPSLGAGALYFVEMDADGGMSKFPSNTAGAKYGTGYCDAQASSSTR